jgi:crotonobetainyl-CoA:carnitine CoA-transferase CaiB-like acyl-CoA transferase
MDDGSTAGGAGHRAQAVAHARQPPPQCAGTLGQDTDAVLREIGLTPAQIAR